MEIYFWRHSQPSSVSSYQSQFLRDILIILQLDPKRRSHAVSYLDILICSKPTSSSVTFSSLQIKFLREICTQSFYQIRSHPGTVSLSIHILRKIHIPWKYILQTLSPSCSHFPRDIIIQLQSLPSEILILPERHSHFIHIIISLLIHSHTVTVSSLWKFLSCQSYPKGQYLTYTVIPPRDILTLSQSVPQGQVWCVSPLKCFYKYFP